jgi:hypothetical protein
MEFGTNGGIFERFSQGYYLGRLYLKASDSGEPKMCRTQHERVNRELYESGEGLERTDLPLVMKVGPRHVAVSGAEDVPADTLAVPESVLADADVRNPPDLQEVFLAKADRAAQLLAMSMGTAV